MNECDQLDVGGAVFFFHLRSIVFQVVFMYLCERSLLFQAHHEVADHTLNTPKCLCEFFFLPASHTQCARLAGPKIALHFPCLFVCWLVCVCLFVGWFVSVCLFVGLYLFVCWLVCVRLFVCWLYLFVCWLVCVCLFVGWFASVCLFVGLWLCASALITCAIVMSCTPLMQCDFT